MASNRLKFEGVLAWVGKPSDLAPSGARGHKISLSKKLTHACLHTLKGQAVNVSSGLDTHDTRTKIGLITRAWMVRDKIHIAGHLWDRDFPDKILQIQAAGDGLGMSFESVNSEVPDMRQAVWEIDPKCFTGAAIVLKKKASFQKSSFKIVKE